MSPVSTAATIRTGSLRMLVSVRARGVLLAEEFREHVKVVLDRKLARRAALIERLSVRFEDVNGPKGGMDIRCRLTCALTGRPPLILETVAATAREAFDTLVPTLARGLRKALAAAQERPGPMRSSESISAPTGSAPVDSPLSLIGRREGRSQRNLAQALARPEKDRKDQPVDTAAPGYSATDRKAGGAHTARRNTKARAGSATAALEDSLSGNPSRKSTRKSANHAKGGTRLQKRAATAAAAPASRARKR